MYIFEHRRLSTTFAEQKWHFCDLMSQNAKIGFTFVDELFSVRANARTVTTDSVLLLSQKRHFTTLLRSKSAKIDRRSHIKA